MNKLILILAGILVSISACDEKTNKNQDAEEKLCEVKISSIEKDVQNCVIGDILVIKDSRPNLEQLALVCEIDSIVSANSRGSTTRKENICIYIGKVRGKRNYVPN